MAVNVQSSGSITINGITYTLPADFTCAKTANGTTDSEGNPTEAVALEKGTVYTVTGYSTPKDSSTTVTHPYRVSVKGGPVRGWFKAEVFPYKTLTISYNKNGGTVKSDYAGNLPTTVLNYNVTAANIYDVSTLFSPPTGWYTPTTDTDYYNTGWIVGSSTATTYAPQKNLNVSNYIGSGNNTNKTFYARWLKDVTLTYNDNGGQGGPGTRDPVTIAKPSSSASFTVHKTIQPTRTGYIFKNWNTAANGGGTTYTPGQEYVISSNSTLYAQWTAKTITVRFNKNDGSGTGPASQSFTYGATGNKFGYKANGIDKYWSVTPGSYADLYGFCQWYRNGYKIIGWAHSPSATTPDYTTYSRVDDSWINSQVGNATSKTIDLYAVWDYNGTVRIYKDGAWKMALPYVYAKVGAETSPSWHLALPYTYAKGTGETSPSWHLNGG